LQLENFSAINHFMPLAWHFPRPPGGGALHPDAAASGAGVAWRPFPEPPMLSYRHAFHAGNHADVLKHTLLLEVLAYFNAKDKPYWYIDTHAGAGCYALTTGYAQQTAEYQAGVARLWEHPGPPALFERYLEALRRYNPDGTLSIYPGSPALAMTQLRAQDRMRLFELHPTDFRLLEAFFRGEAERVRLACTDGFDALKALLPPPTRRAVVLIDPPYEIKADYKRAIEALRGALKRFAGGTYLLWYPLLARSEVRQLCNALQRLDQPNWLKVELRIGKAGLGAAGMYGSGVFIINPPWVLPERLKAGLPTLVELLGEDAGAGFEVDYRVA
jgi:23S rRNA (adenine2030-N6)-methyltransferase